MSSSPGRGEADASRTRRPQKAREAAAMFTKNLLIF
jgi:hypothetical protein